MKLLFFQKNAPIFVVMHTSYTQYAIPVWEYDENVLWQGGMWM
jgi:hypothetical protein